MPRQFGLKTMRTVAPASSVSPSPSGPSLRALASVQTAVDQYQDIALELSATPTDLPFSPSSWRGSRRRRSTSAN